ncbi:MAG: hypothetical protein ACOYOO_07425 [Saprospiraceae bacterium]|jgi:hypothetical protein
MAGQNGGSPDIQVHDINDSANNQEISLTLPVRDGEKQIAQARRGYTSDPMDAIT